jgi:MFS family permease
LYAAPAVGAVVTSAVMVPLTERIDHRGRTLLLAISGFGLATVVFGISRSFWLTFFCLAMTGATDTVSMIIRNIVRQLETPDRLRGRMIGVNMIFFQGGPQLGELEAGAVANWLGATFCGQRRDRLPGRDRVGRGDDAGAQAISKSRRVDRRTVSGGAFSGTAGAGDRGPRNREHRRCAGRAAQVTAA